MRIARAEIEDLRSFVSTKDDQLSEARLAHDELEDDMNDVEGRLREQTEVLLGLRTKLADATETVHATARLRMQAHDLEIDVATLREQLSLASEGVRSAEKELENERAAAKSQTKRHDVEMSRLSTRCDRLQGELGATKDDFEVARNQAQEMERRLSECQERLASESDELAKVRRELASTRSSLELVSGVDRSVNRLHIDNDSSIVTSAPGRAAGVPQTPAPNTGDSGALLAMYANGEGDSPSRHGSSSSALTPGRLGHDIAGGATQAPAFLHEQHYGVEPVRLDGIGFSRTEAMKFVRYLETLAALSLYNVRVWSSNVDEKAFRTLSNRVLETQIAQAHPARPWFEKWTLDIIIAALKEVYDPHRFDTSAEK